MPKPTFYKISSEKQRIILNAGLDEFENLPFEQVSVKNIVIKAMIPRGSFYAYFNDLEDMYEYIIKDLHDTRLNQVRSILVSHNHDFFTFIIAFFKNDIEHLKLKSKNLLLKHYYRYIITSKFGDFFDTLFDSTTPLNLFKLLDTHDLFTKAFIKYTTVEKIKLFEYVMSIYLQTYLLATSDSYTFDEVIELFEYRLNIIKKGIS